MLTVSDGVAEGTREDTSGDLLAELLAGEGFDVEVAPAAEGVEITATVETTAQTGVEMEALTAASVAALTVYDMAKAVDKEMVIEDVKLLEKTKS